MRVIRTLTFFFVVGFLIWYGANCFEEIVATHELNITYQQAEAGDVNAQIRLAAFLKQGTFGIGVNHKEAIRWLNIASNRGSKSAKAVLCNDYEIGCEK